MTSTGRFGIKLGLERVRALLAELGDPQAGLRGALVAGTNGKGSTCAFLESMLRAAGMRTGFMPKPHLSSYTERIQVDGRPIAEAEFARAVAELRPVIDVVSGRLGPPTEFEILTALAIPYLAARVDVLVCEVGMGGRLDATNVLDLGIAVITNVALDHQQYLGATIPEIAAEKAAIFKPGNLVVSGCTPPARSVVLEQAQAAGTTFQELHRDIRFESETAGWSGSRLTVRVGDADYRDLQVPLLGPWQAGNASLALACAHSLGIDAEAIRAGIASTRWPGRLEVVSQGPRVLVDGGHNPAALDQVVPFLRELLRGSSVALVFAAMADKDLGAMLDRLRQLEPRQAVFTRAESAVGRAADPQDLARLWGPGAVALEPAAAAVQRASEVVGPDGVVLVCGSLYLVGEVRGLLVGPA